MRSAFPVPAFWVPAFWVPAPAFWVRVIGGGPFKINFHRCCSAHRDIVMAGPDDAGGGFVNVVDWKQSYDEVLYSMYSNFATSIVYHA